MKVSGRHPGADCASCIAAGIPLFRGSRVVNPRSDKSDECPDPTTADSPQPGLLSAWRALLTASDPQFCGFQRFNPVSSGGHSLSRIAQLDQRTALPDQCLHSAEADVRPARAVLFLFECCSAKPVSTLSMFSFEPTMPSPEPWGWT